MLNFEEVYKKELGYSISLLFTRISQIAKTESKTNSTVIVAEIRGSSLSLEENNWLVSGLVFTTYESIFSDLHFYI